MNAMLARLTPEEIAMANEGTYTDFADRIGLMGSARQRAIEADIDPQTFQQEAA